MDLTKIRFYQLFKQNLLAPANPADYHPLLNQHLALHSTDYQTPYLSLWARVRDFEPAALLHDLSTSNQVVRLRAFRGTLFLIHRDDLNLILSAGKIFMASILKQNAKFLIKAGFDLTRMEQQVVELLAKHQELSVHAFKKLLPDISADKYFTYTLRYLEFKGVLVRTNHRAIMDRGIKYALMTVRFPELLNPPLTPEAALNLLVLRYITKFGPIGFDDLCWWLSISRTTARKVLTALAAQLVTLDWEPQEYFMEKNDYQQFHDFKPPAPPIEVINFLPYEDAFPKAFLHRDWFLPEAVAPLVYKAGAINLGQIFPSIWLNGSIIGGWTMNWVDAAHTAMRVEITGLHEPEKLNPSVRLQIENQRARLEKFMNEKMLPNLK